jgi:peptidase S51-like protein
LTCRTRVRRSGPAKLYRFYGEVVSGLRECARKRRGADGARGGRRQNRGLGQPLDMEPDAERREWLGTETRALASAGFSPVELDLRGYYADPAALVELLARLDMVWATGGNVFVLRKALHRSRLDELLLAHLGDDSLAYGGCSAGACVCGPTLRVIDQSQPLKDRLPRSVRVVDQIDADRAAPRSRWRDRQGDRRTRSPLRERRDAVSSAAGRPGNRGLQRGLHDDRLLLASLSASARHLGQCSGLTPENLRRPKSDHDLWLQPART